MCEEGFVKYFICGFSGSGKTTKLNEISKMSDYKGYEFVDLDEYLYENHGSGYQSIGDMIEKKGFEWFRHAEKAALLKLLEDKKDVWIALGGGTLDEDLCTFLSLRSDVKGYWLDASFDLCWERIKEDPERPLVKHGEEKLREIYQNRQNHYKNFDKLTL